MERHDSWLSLAVVRAISYHRADGANSEPSFQAQDTERREAVCVQERHELGGHNHCFLHATRGWECRSARLRRASSVRDFRRGRARRRARVRRAGGVDAT